MLGNWIPPNCPPKNKIARKLFTYRRLTLNFVDWNPQISNLSLDEILALESFIVRYAKVIDNL